MGSNIKVGDIMVKNVITLEKGNGLVDAATIMKKYSIGSVVITDKSKAIGILTERDIIRKAVARNNINRNVEDVMSFPIVVIKPENTIEEAVTAMKENGVKRLIVIDEEGVLKGIITEDDIINILPSLLDLIEERVRIE